MNNLIKSFLFVLFLFGIQSANAQVAVIVSAKSDIATMTADQVSSIFLGKSDKYPNGSTALPIDQPNSSPIRVSFYDKVTGKSEAQVKSAWSRLVFSGKGTPPKEIASTGEVKKLVSSNPSTIGYIEKSAVDASVKVVFSAD